VAGRLHTLSPFATLARGYSVARGRDGATLSSVQAFQPNGLFDLVVRDGIVPARVDGVPQRSAS
jgi:exonuclease VII large subunit